MPVTEAGLRLDATVFIFLEKDTDTNRQQVQGGLIWGHGGVDGLEANTELRRLTFPEQGVQ